MSYGYNRAAFKAVRIQAGLPPLVVSYCSLVVAELALKEHLGLINTAAHCGHDLPNLLDRLRPSTGGARKSLAAMKTQFRHKLARLRCQTRSGTPGFVLEQNYPDLRYIRHTEDWPGDSSSDEEVRQLKTMTDRLLRWTTVQFPGLYRFSQRLGNESRTDMVERTISSVNSF